jgi:hypothetical protein
MPTQHSNQELGLSNLSQRPLNTINPMFVYFLSNFNKDMEIFHVITTFLFRLHQEARMLGQ